MAEVPSTPCWRDSTFGLTEGTDVSSFPGQGGVSRLMAWCRDHPTRAGCVLRPGRPGPDLRAPHGWHLEPDQVCRVCGGWGRACAAGSRDSEECGIGWWAQAPLDLSAPPPLVPRSALYASRLYLGRYQDTHPERLARHTPGGPHIRGTHPVPLPPLTLPHPLHLRCGREGSVSSPPYPDVFWGIFPPGCFFCF